MGLIAADEEPILDYARDGHVALLVGETQGHLGQSALLYEVFNREDGDAPTVDLAAEKAAGEFIRANRDWIRCCTDLSDGGLALAAFEMAAASGVGVQIDTDDTATLFGEDQGRYLIACNFDSAEALMIAAGRAGVHVTSVGRFTGDSVRFGRSEAPLAELKSLSEGTFQTLFG